MRPIGNFVRSRIHRVGFKNVDDFARQTKLGKPTLYRILKAEHVDDVNSHDGTLELLAEHLKFREWRDVLAACEADDVRAGLGPDHWDRLSSLVREIMHVEGLGAEGVWEEFLEREDRQDDETFGGEPKTPTEGRGPDQSKPSKPRSRSRRSVAGKKPAGRSK